MFDLQIMRYTILNCVRRVDKFVKVTESYRRKELSKQKITGDVSDIAGISYPSLNKSLSYFSQAGWQGSQAGSQGLHGATQ